MGAAFAFGLGVVIGSLVTFRAGGDYALWKQARGIADEYVGAANRRRGTAMGSLGLLAVAVVLGAMIMIFSQ